jgi:hypothetical protein
VNSAVSATESAATFSDALANSYKVALTDNSKEDVDLSRAGSSHTIPTSNFDFDPLCVVGIVPESNAFLQFMRRLLGKPLSSSDTQPLISTPAAGSLGTSSPAKSTLESNSLSSIDAQLNYLGSASQISPPPQSIFSARTLAVANKNVVAGDNLSSLLDHYATDLSGYGSANAQSDLVGSLGKDAQASK